MEPHESDVVEEADEAEEEFQLDPEVIERRRAALAQVRQFGDPVLKSKASPVREFDERLREEVALMAGIMRDSLGVGLAANQVGLLQRLLVFQAGRDAPVTALVNPALEWSSDVLETADEGCLSLVGVIVEVERPLHVRVRGSDEWGEEMLLEASGLEARVLQHEMDHLDGVLILDRTSKEQRREAIETLRGESDADHLHGDL